MKFGIREICNVVFRAKSPVKIGNTNFKIGQPVLYIDTAKTSTLEGAVSTVYATGGRGNTRLIGWDSEKTLTFTIEDALLSPIGFAILSGAGLLKGTEDEYVHVHNTTPTFVGTDGIIDLDDILEIGDKLCPTAPLFVLRTEVDGSSTGEIYEIETVEDRRVVCPDAAGKNVIIDYYIVKKSAHVSELQIDANHFAGYYYVEAETLARRQDTGVDMPAVLTLPNVKIQSNFTFSMSASGDPSEEEMRLAA